MDINPNQNPENQPIENLEQTPAVEVSNEQVAQTEAVQPVAPVQAENQPVANPVQPEVSAPAETIQPVAPTQVETAPQAVNFQAQPANPVAFAPEAPKKSKLPIIIASVIGSIVLLGGGIFAVFILLQPQGFNAIIDKDLACEVSQGGISVSLGAKFTKDKKFTAKVNFIMTAETTADYEIVSQDGKVATLKISNPVTTVNGQKQESSSSPVGNELKLDFENFGKDKSIKVSSSESASVALTCKLKQ